MRKMRKMRKTNGEWQLAGRTNQHHNFAKSRGGSYARHNIFNWDINVHRAFHFLFGNRTLLEAAEWLKQVHQAKLNDVELNVQDKEFNYNCPT